VYAAVLGVDIYVAQDSFTEFDSYDLTKILAMQYRLCHTFGILWCSVRPWIPSYEPLEQSGFQIPGGQN